MPPRRSKRARQAPAPAPAAPPAPAPPAAPAAAAPIALPDVLPDWPPASAAAHAAAAAHAPAPAAPRTAPELAALERRIANLLAPSVPFEDVERLVGSVTSATAAPVVPADMALDPTPMDGGRGWRCTVCGNRDEARFVVDNASGDTICTGVSDAAGCGNVVQDHRVHEGSQYRNFEGEEDKSHHGPAPNRLYSSSMNLRTSISKLGDNAQNLRRLAEDVEMNLSQMGKDDRRTRTGYKDSMKRKAFEQMHHVAANLNLHDSVVGRAQKAFARHRDEREHVHAFEAVIAACLIHALRTAPDESVPPAGAGAAAAAAAGAAGAANGAQPKRQRVSRVQADKMRDDKTLHPFECGKCHKRFSDRRSMKFHPCDGSGGGRGAGAGGGAGAGAGAAPAKAKATTQGALSYRAMLAARAESSSDEDDS